MNNTKSSLFLMEQLIAITVFAICATVCAAIFVSAYTTASDANDLNHALVAARNGAEVLKATDCLDEAAAILGGYAYSSEKTVVYFDSNWQATYRSDALYVLNLAESGNSPEIFELSVHNIYGDEIIAFNVATGRRQST